MSAFLTPLFLILRTTYLFNEWMQLITVEKKFWDTEWWKMRLGEVPRPFLEALIHYPVLLCLVAQLCPTLCDPMDCSSPGFLVHHQFLEVAQTHGHWVGDAIQPSHPHFPLLLLPSNFFSIRVFSNELVLCIRWPSISFSISPSSEYSGLISFRMDWIDLLALQGNLKSLL